MNSSIITQEKNELLKNKGFKKALVTGGAGFIGSHLVDNLLESGLSVTSVDNYVSGKKENLKIARDYDNFTEVNLSVTDSDNIDQILDGCDVIFHQAASKMTVCMNNPTLDLQVNAGGTLALLRKAAEHGVKKFIHVSTGSVYGRAQYTPTDESHNVNPVSFYGVSKLAGEKYARLFADEFGLDVTILRYFHVYGPRQESSDVGGVVSIFARNVLEGSPITIYGDGNQVRLFTYVDDVVRANIFAACTDGLTGRAFNCNSDNKVSITELANQVCRELGNKNHSILYRQPRVGDVKDFDVSNDALKSLGFTWKTEFNEGLKKTLEWSKKWFSINKF